MENPSFITKINFSHFSISHTFLFLALFYFSHFSISRTFLFLALFYFSLIERISIHSNVTEIDKEAFSYCFNLSGVGISSDSQLGIINNGTYSESTIRKFAVSPHLTKTYSFIKQIYIFIFTLQIFSRTLFIVAQCSIVLILLMILNIK